MSGGGGQEREIKKIQWEESGEGHLFGMHSPGKYKAARKASMHPHVFGTILF